MSLTITKAKLLKGDKLEVEYSKTIEGQKKPVQGGEKYPYPPHVDLVTAFAALDIHAALIGEFVPLIQVPDIKNVDEAITAKFHVSGITMVGADSDDEGVILTAQKTLSKGKMLGFNTPTERFNDTADNCYPYLDELLEACDKVVLEVDLYMKGKYGSGAQQELQLKEEQK